MPRPLRLLILASLALAGCNSADKQDATFDDIRNPYYKQAQEDIDDGKPEAAAQDYENALAVNPQLVTAQYQLGLLYAEKLQDPISSIFHFKRFLDLAPNSDHATNAKEMIDKESQAFAAGLPSSTSSQSADEIAKLQSDNAALRKQVDDAAKTISELQDQLAEAKRAPPPPPPAPTATETTATETAATPAASTPAAGAVADNTAATNAAPAGPLRALPLDATNNIPGAASATTAGSGPSRSYTVVKGDSLWKIAHKMYPGDTKNGEDKIRDANKDVFNGKFLKPGQVLVIPQ